MTTAQTLINRAYELLGYKDPDETLSTSDAQAGLDALNSMIDGWNSQSLFIVSTDPVVASVGSISATVGTGQTFDIARPVRLEQGGFTRIGGIDYPLEVIERIQYDQIPLKTVVSTFPQYAYYNATVPTGTVYFYPVPVSAVSIYLPFETQLSAFADLTTSYNLAAGYRRAIEYSLAEELAPGRRTLEGKIAQTAFLARRAIRRNNVDVPQLDSMPKNVRFNIYTGL